MILERWPDGQDGLVRDWSHWPTCQCHPVSSRGCEIPLCPHPAQYATLAIELDDSLGRVDVSFILSCHRHHGVKGQMLTRNRQWLHCGPWDDRLPSCPSCPSVQLPPCSSRHGLFCPASNDSPRTVLAV